MIQQAPGYNLTLNRKPVRLATGQRMIQKTRSGVSGNRSLPRLNELCEGIDILGARGDLFCPVNDLCLDSRRVSPGALFFALPGDQLDGSFYIQDAIDRGAAAVITAKSGLHHPRATIVQVADARAAMAVIARRFFKFSAASPGLIGVVGSYGKTSVSHLLQHLLAYGEEPVGLFSSIHYDLGSRTVPSYRTTPEAVDLYGMLAQMKENGCRRTVLEISARGIEQERLSGLPLDVAVFLNGEVDSEMTSEKCEALFTGSAGMRPGAVAIHLDDPNGRRLIPQIPEEIPVITFGKSLHADIRATEIVEGEGGAIIRIVWPEGTARVRMRQPGSFAVSNLLAAVAAAYAAGADLYSILPRVFSFEGTAGRFEEIDEGQPFRVIVDAARTPGAIRHALRAAREISGGRLLAVFGCVGNRAPAERAEIVQAVEQEADFSWVTAHNPGNEPLENIFEDVYKGAIRAEELIFVNDRRRAIALALDTARPGDVVVLLGKGNEAFQSVGDAVLPFNDRLVVRELLALRQVALSAI